MSSMRRLINIMESVSVDESLLEKSTSEKQARTMAAAAHDPKFAKKVGIPQDIAREFNKADIGTTQLSNAMKQNESIDDREITDQEVKDAYTKRREAFAADLPNKYQLADYASMLANKYAQQQSVKHNGRSFDPVSGYPVQSTNESPDDIKSSLHPVNTIKQVITQLYPGPTSMTAVSHEVPQLASNPEFAEWYKKAHDSFYGLDIDFDGEDVDGMDGYTDYTMRQGEMGNPDRDMEEDLDNGYEDISVVDGVDLFPTGADRAVVSSTGPSSAKHGDNPMQKRMQVAETHKELVYAYRKFIKESAVIKKNKLSESIQVSDFRVEANHGEFRNDNSSIDFIGVLSMAATVSGQDGNPVNIGFDVEVNASAPLNWVTDERDVAGPYGPESDRFESYQFPERGDITVSTVTFADDYDIDNSPVSLDELKQTVGEDVLRQLLNPTAYVAALTDNFDAALEDIEYEDDNEPAEWEIDAYRSRRGY